MVLQFDGNVNIQMLSKEKQVCKLAKGVFLKKLKKLNFLAAQVNSQKSRVGDAASF